MTRPVLLLALALFAVLFSAALSVGDRTHRNLAAGLVGPSPAASTTAVRVDVSPRLLAAHARRQHPHRRTTSLDWDALAECESGGDWSVNSGNGYYGGIQFLQRTWESFHGTDFAPRADLAARWQQIRVAERVLRTQGLVAWPACTLKLGWR